NVVFVAEALDPAIPSVRRGEHAVEQHDAGTIGVPVDAVVNFGFVDGEELRGRALVLLSELGGLDVRHTEPLTAGKGQAQQHAEEKQAGGPPAKLKREIHSALVRKCG